MSSFVRASKYRHVYVDAPKATDTYNGIRLSTAVGEQNYIKGNPKFFAVALAGGGGPFTVLPYESKGQVPLNLPIFAGHKGDVLDFDFNPFHDHVIASGSDDTSIKVWGIPDGGLKENVTEPLVDLRGHERKVTLLRFHPTAMHLLGSASADNTVRLWDVEQGKEMGQCHNGAHEQLIQDLQWDFTGKVYATTSKDKTLRVVDARTGQMAASKAEAHEGAKSSKCTFLGPRDLLLTVGFTKQSQRQIKVWDMKRMDRELKTIDIVQAAGVIMPFFDPDSNLLYLAGKGDGNIRYYELVAEAPQFIFPISEYRSTTPCKGCALVPKRGLDVMKCETARLLKLTTTSVEPLSFIVPRKGDFFQEDLFPPAFAGQPSHPSPSTWLTGPDTEPKTMSLDPAKRPSSTSTNPLPLGASNGNGGSVQSPSMGGLPPRPRSAKSPTQLQKELDAAMARISLLESRLKAAGLDYS